MRLEKSKRKDLCGRIKSRDNLFFCQIKESCRQTSRHLPAIKAFVTCTSLRKQPTFCDGTNGFPAKWRLKNERRNSILMTCHYPDLGSAFDWSCRVGNLFQPIRSTTQIWVVTRHHYGISALISQTPFRGETVGAVAKCRLFSQATPAHFLSVFLSTDVLSPKRSADSYSPPGYPW